MTQLSYDAAGVSIDNGDELVERIKPFDDALYGIFNNASLGES